MISIIYNSVMNAYKNKQPINYNDLKKILE